MDRNNLLYVENISPSSTEEHLITYLEKWAPILQVYFLREKQCTKRSIAAFVRVANEADLDMLMLRNQQNYRGKRLFMVRVDQTQFFQADHSVIVRNITSKISEENLFDHFEECGKIAFLQIRTDDFAYIGFEEKASVRNAMNKNNMPLKGSNLKIQLLTRNIEIMIVNLDTLNTRMPGLYRKMMLPVEPRPSGTVQQQSAPLQQQQSQPEKQQQQQQPQQFGNQQPQSQPTQQQYQPQYGNQRQQQPQQQQNQRSQQPQQQQQNQRSQQPQQQQNQRPQQPQQQQNQRQQQPQQQQQNQRQPQQQQNQRQPQQQQQQNQRQPQQQQQQQQQNQRQQQQQQNQRQQQQQRGQPQQQPLPQRQQQQPLPQGQQQQMSTIQMLKEKANTLADKQQPQQAAVVEPVKPAAPVQEQPKKQDAVPSVTVPAVAPVAEDDNDDVQIIEPMDTAEILVESDSESLIIDTSVIPPIPSAYKQQPNDIMRPVKAAEIPLGVAEVNNARECRSVWVNNIRPETSRLQLVLYMEQFGDVASCKIGLSKNCYFTRWAKVTFTNENAANKATEYFLHPFQGGYLFVLACDKCIDAIPGRVFVLDYLSKYLVYEDVVKSFKHAGDVFYLVRVKDNTHKVRIFFLNNVNAEAVLAVKSIGGIPVNVKRYEGADLEHSKAELEMFRRERDIINPRKEARMARILEIYKEELFNRCDPVVNPEGKTEGNEVLITNVHRSTSDAQIIALFKSIGKPIFIRREKDALNNNFERIFVGFRTHSMIMKAAELSTQDTLNGFVPFIFAAWTKPHMSERNALRFVLSSQDFTVQDIYDGLIQFGKIRYVEKEKQRKVVVVFDGHDNGFVNCNVVQSGFQIGPVTVQQKESVLGKRSHESAFSDCENGHPAKSNFIPTSASPGSNAHPENDDVVLIDSPTEQQQASVDKSTHKLDEHTFKTGTWNVSGCTKESDRAHVDSFLSYNGVIVGCLQDTRLSTGTMDTSTYHWYNVNRKAESARIDGGVSLVVRRDLMPCCIFRQVSEDICSVRLDVFGKLLTVVCVYARFLDVPDPAIETLHDFLRCLPSRQRSNVVVLGDFKAHIGIQDINPADRRSVGKLLHHPWSNTNGIGLQNILHHHNLRLTSSFGPSSSVMCTWSKGDEKSQTSHIMMPYIERFLRPHCYSLRDASGFSDHHLLILAVKNRAASAPSATSQIGSPKYVRTLGRCMRIKGYFNLDCKAMVKERKTKITPKEKAMMRNVSAAAQNECMVLRQKVAAFEHLLLLRNKKEANVAPSKDAEKQPQEESIVIDDEDDEVVEAVQKTPNKNTQSVQNEKKQQNQKNPQNKQQQQKGPPQKQQQQQKKQQQQPRQQQPRQQQQQQRQQQQRQQLQQQRSGRDRNRNPFADNRSPQRNHPYQQQQQHQDHPRRSINPWDGQDEQEGFWNEQFNQQLQFQRQQRDQFMPDDRFNRDDGPFDMMNQGGNNMNEFDQMMAQQFGNFSMNQQNDNGFNNCGPMDSDDPPLDRPWGNQQHQQQHFNRFSPPRQRSPYGRGFRDERDDNDFDFGRDSPGIPPNIPDDEIDEYIMRKQEAIKRRLEQLDRQLITSVESSRHRDSDQGHRRRKGTVFSDNGDVHYVPNPAAVARNRERRGAGFGGNRRGGRGSGNGESGRAPKQNQRRRSEMNRKQTDPFADVDIVPIIRISEDRSPSPKRNREDEFDTAQFDAAWS